MKKPKIKELKLYLQNKNEKELIDEIVEIFKMNKQVQEYYALKVIPENEEMLLAEYKEKVTNQFFPSRGMNVLNYNVLRTLVNDFEKIAINKSSVIELLLCYAENGVEFTNTYGDMDDRFYSNIAKVYEKALGLIRDTELKKTYVEKCQHIMDESFDIGWGFSDWMSELFYDCLGDYIDQ